MSTKKEESVEAKFSKLQILEAKKYRDQVDIVNALLVEGTVYSIQEVDALIDKFMKGTVSK